MSPVEDILELARWAPSGDNAQPWRFRLLGEREFEVYGYDTAAHCVYDLDGWASQLAHGMLLETIVIAAARYGWVARIEVPDEDTTRPLRYRIALEAAQVGVNDALSNAVIGRTVQRRAMWPRALTARQRASLEEAALPLRVRWFESWTERTRIAALSTRNARIRLTIPEAYAVHRSVIAWHSTASEDRLPDASLGASAGLLALMRTAMASWKRLDRFNRWTGTLVPRLALDFIPGLGCSAQLAAVGPRDPSTLADRITAGRAIQRLWLTADTLGLQMQPLYTPLVFARYDRSGRSFTSVSKAAKTASGVARSMDGLLGPDAGRAVWLARIGPARRTRGRSLRLPLSKLIVTIPPDELPKLDPR